MSSPKMSTFCGINKKDCGPLFTAEKETKNGYLRLFLRLPLCLGRRHQRVVVQSVYGWLESQSTLVLSTTLPFVATFRFTFWCAWSGTGRGANCLWRRHHHHGLLRGHHHWRRLHRRWLHVHWRIRWHHHWLRRWSLAAGGSTGWLALLHGRHRWHWWWKGREWLRVAAPLWTGWIASLRATWRARWWWLNWRRRRCYHRRRRAHNHWWWLRGHHWWRCTTACLLALIRTGSRLNWRHLRHSAPWVDSCRPFQANGRTLRRRSRHWHWHWWGRRWWWWRRRWWNWHTTWWLTQRSTGWSAWRPTWTP